MKEFFYKRFAYIGPVLLAVLVALDQWTKALAVSNLKGKQPFVILEGVFEFYYFENTGAAWGMLKDKQIFFYILTALFCGLVFFEIYRLYKKKRFTPFVYTLIFMAAGAIGNFIDRLRMKYVVDFLYFKLIDFPIFNIADCYITLSVIVMMLLMFFYYSEEEFDDMIPFFAGKKKKELE